MRKGKQVLAIGRHGKPVRRVRQSLPAQISAPVGDFLRAGDLAARLLLHGLDGHCHVAEALRRAGVEPRHIPIQDDNLELALLQIYVVDCGDFQLTSGGGGNPFGNFHHLVVVEIEAGNNVST